MMTAVPGRSVLKKMVAVELSIEVMTGGPVIWIDPPVTPDLEVRKLSSLLLAESPALFWLLAL